MNIHEKQKTVAKETREMIKQSLLDGYITSKDILNNKYLNQAIFSEYFGDEL